MQHVLLQFLLHCLAKIEVKEFREKLKHEQGYEMSSQYWKLLETDLFLINTIPHHVRKDISIFQNANRVLIFNYILNLSSSGEKYRCGPEDYCFITLSSPWYLMNIDT